MDQGLWAFVMLLVLAAVAIGVLLLVSALIRRRRASENDGCRCECGIDPAGTPGRKFSAKYFLTAILFMVFGVQLVLLVPWAIAYRSALADGAGMEALCKLLLFLALGGLALAYAWGRGALEWEK